MSYGHLKCVAKERSLKNVSCFYDLLMSGAGEEEDSWTGITWLYFCLHNSQQNLRCIEFQSPLKWSNYKFVTR